MARYLIARGPKESYMETRGLDYEEIVEAKAKGGEGERSAIAGRAPREIVHPKQG